MSQCQVCFDIGCLFLAFSFCLFFVIIFVWFVSVALDGPSTSMTGVFRTIVSADGMTGLYRGMTANFLKVAPAVSISYAVYEHVRAALGVKMT